MGDITDWQEELKPYYDQAQRMLGVRLNPTMTPSDVHLKAAAERMGVGDTFHMAPVGVFFGDGEDADGTVEGAARRRQVDDPYFGGAGPARKACTECGECMTGCRHGAKNTLNENYLYLAEQAGAVIHPMTTVVSVTEDSQGGYAVATAPDRRANARARGRTFKARRVVLAAGTYGTQTLLHRMKDGRSAAVPLRQAGRADPYQLRGAGRRADRQPPLPQGHRRGEGRLHPRSRDHVLDPPRRRTPTSSRSATARARTRWALCPSSKSPTRRARRGCSAGWSTRSGTPPCVARSLSNRRWSERTIIGLVMQSLDNSLTTYRKPNGRGQGPADRPPGPRRPQPQADPEAARRPPPRSPRRSTASRAATSAS